ncbi:hypothetical protein Scep_030537 [Stephania cephalantha]|uniref:At4g15545-like C-terminal domain-containing protein n=1 Tax=Stephania cephalantha TaxID=152367 RepID=A0AAP0DZY6_9MAGN
MLAKESSGLGKFDLPEEVEAVLPSDPFEQLDIARKITSIALATRVSKLESESSRLRSTLHERDDLIADLQSQIESLHASLAQSTDRLAQADSLKERLLLENASLSNTVKKLNRDVSKLEAFRKTLMRSLQEEEDTSQAMAPPSVSKQIPADVKLSSDSHHGEEDAALPPSKSTSSVQSQFSETVNSSAEDGASVETDVSQAASIYGASQTPLLASYASTPKLTPPGSPPSLSASVSPTTSKPTSPRRYSMSFSTTRGTFDDRSSIFSSMPSSHHSSLSSSSDLGSQSGRTRVDGKEFFRQVRTRLSYEQFGAFLANVKELNSHKKSREETLRKADEIFGAENKDLYLIFEGLITRNAH